MINWKNLVENLIIVVVALIVGLFGGYMMTIKTAETMLDNQKSLIEEAIRKETTSISNQFKTEIRKLKAKDGSNVDLRISPKLENQIIQQNQDTIVKKKGFLKRIFNKNTE